MGNKVILGAEANPFPRTTDEEAFGCRRYDGPPKTVEEMDEGVGQGIRKMWRNFEAQFEGDEDRRG